MKSSGTPEAHRGNSELEHNAVTPFESITPKPSWSKSESQHTQATEARAEVAAGTAQGKASVQAPAMTHGLVRFGSLYGIYYVPEKLRGAIQIGDLLLVEAAHGTGTGTLIADLSAQAATVKRNYADYPYLELLVRHEGSDTRAQEQVLNDVLYPEDRVSSDPAPGESPVPRFYDVSPQESGHTSSDIISCHESTGKSSSRVNHAKESLDSPGGACRRPRFELYAKAPASGLPEHDDWLQRLPRVLRRGINKDKKKMYFSRKRDGEALHLVTKTIWEKNWGAMLSVSSVSYQVDFLSATIFPFGGEGLYGRKSPAQPGTGATTGSQEATAAISPTEAMTGCAPPRWGRREYASVGAMLSAPLRTDIVEFRFVLQYPELTNLTRNIIGNFYNYKCEAEMQLFDRAQSLERSNNALSNLTLSDNNTHVSVNQPLAVGPTMVAPQHYPKPLPVPPPSQQQQQQQQQQSQPHIVFAAADSGTFASHPQFCPAIISAPPLPSFMPTILSTVPAPMPSENALAGPGTPYAPHRYSLHSDASGLWVSQPQVPSLPQPQHHLEQRPQTAPLLEQKAPAYGGLPPYPSQPPVFAPQQPPQQPQQPLPHQAATHFFSSSANSNSGGTAGSVIHVSIPFPPSEPSQVAPPPLPHHHHQQNYQQLQQPPLPAQQFFYMLAEPQGPPGSVPDNGGFRPVGRAASSSLPSGVPSANDQPIQTIHVLPNYQQ